MAPTLEDAWDQIVAEMDAYCEAIYFQSVLTVHAHVMQFHAQAQAQAQAQATAECAANEVTRHEQGGGSSGRP